MNTARLDLNALHGQFRPQFLHYVTRLVGEAEAEDITQCVMLKVNEGLSRFRGGSSVSTWIYSIATNVAVDRLRQRAAQQLTETEHEFDEDDLPAAVPWPGQRRPQKID